MLAEGNAGVPNLTVRQPHVNAASTLWWCIIELEGASTRRSSRIVREVLGLNVPIIARRSLVAAALAAFAPLPAAAAEHVTALTVRAGHSLVIETPHLTRVGVGDKDIAGVFPIGNSEVVINGKATGQTTVFTWSGTQHKTYEITVIDQTLEDLVSTLSSSIALPNVAVSHFDRSVVVKGTVDNAEQSLRVDDVMARFAKSAQANKYELVNAVTVANPMRALQVDLASMTGVSDVAVERDGKGNLIVSGRVGDRSVAEKVLARVRARAGTTLAADGKILDRLAVDTTTQVDIKVYVLEVDRTAQSQLGLRLQSGIPDKQNPGFFTLGPPNFPALERPVNSPFNIGIFSRTTVLAPTLDLVLSTGHARVLSAPDLVTMPGQLATFLVGGQIPIPYPSGPQQIAIQYKDFGVQLKVTPTILGNGNVETVIAPEVSDLDFADGILLNGFSIPALKTSRISTDVVTKSGESIVMGGLMRRVEQRTITKIPLLGDIPILGQLFRSTNYQKSESDLVFVMTPQILVR